MKNGSCLCPGIREISSDVPNMLASEIIRRYRLYIKKGMDQHFLVDKNIIRKEVELAEVESKDIVLEIGAGFGLLTEELLNKAMKVIAIEKDSTLALVLRKEFRERIKEGALKVMEGDALELSYPRFDKCVSNIPYSITSAILERLANYRKDSTLCVQKEFAERLISKPGSKNYSRISILVQFYFVPRYLWTVSRNSFFPKPRVDSAIIRLLPRKKVLRLKDEKKFFEMVKLLFSHKRKNVRNALLAERRNLGMEKQEAMDLFKNAPFASRKVFQLSIEELITIYEWILEELQPFKV